MIALILSDDKILRTRTYKALQKVNNVKRILETDQIREAERILLTHNVHLFIIDLGICNDEGYTFLTSLRQRNSFQLTWTMAIGNRIEDVDELMDGYNRGLFHRYIVKPAPVTLITEMVEDLLRKKLVDSCERKRLKIRRKSVDHYFNYDEILFVETVEKMSYIHTPFGKQKVGRITLGEMEEMLDDECFQRIHRSYIVNTEYIDFIDRQNNQSLIKIKYFDHMIPIGRTYKNVVSLV